MQRKLEALRRLLETIDALRGPQGCPWDKAQTLRTVSRYILEEASEAVDAIDEAEGKPTESVSEELGDVLMTVFLAARIAEDEGGFDAHDVAERISEKLVRRHPHVFGDSRVDGVDEVLTHWNAIKEQEKRQSGSPEPQSRLDSVPRSLPVLERAHQLSREAAKVGFDWPDAWGAFDKVLEETEEVRSLLGARETPQDARSAEMRDQLESELGDVLFAVANLCRKLEVRPDVALRRTLRKFCQRFQEIEGEFSDLEKVDLEQMEAVWQRAKRGSTVTPSRADALPRESTEGRGDGS